MNESSRMGWISHLEAHYSRYLALAIKSTCGELEKATARVADRTHPFLISNRDDGKGREPEALLQHLIRVSCKELVDQAEEARGLIETAYRVPDEHLDKFVRWHTMPKWRELMESEGFKWDDENLRWEGPDGW